MTLMHDTDLRQSYRRSSFFFHMTDGRMYAAMNKIIPYRRILK